MFEKEYFLDPKTKQKPVLLQYYYSKFSYYPKFVESTINSDKLNMYRNIDNGLKKQPTKFYKHISPVTKQFLYISPQYKCYWYS